MFVDVKNSGVCGKQKGWRHENTECSITGYRCISSVHSVSSWTHRRDIGCCEFALRDMI